MPDESEILFEQRDRLGLITLNRPRALNALTHGMCVAMRERLEHWATDETVAAVAVRGAGNRAFCAGGDIRSLYDSGKAGTPYARNFYRDEYLLDARIKHYPKPYIALIGGIVMGGGVGISVNGRYRVADETTTFAMPETGIGLFPDVGGSFFLPRLPGGSGMYLALTGARLGGRETVSYGLATQFVARSDWESLLDKLASGLSPDAAFSIFGGSEPQPTALQIEHKRIDTIFSRPSLKEVLVELSRDRSDWGRDTAAVIGAKSPTSTLLAFRQLKEGARLDFDACLRMEFRMVNRVIAGHDFYEGVRATIIDKDGAPKWRPAKLSEISESDIDRYFEPLDDELPL